MIWIVLKRANIMGTPLILLVLIEKYVGNILNLSVRHVMRYFCMSGCNTDFYFITILRWKSQKYVLSNVGVVYTSSLWDVTWPSKIKQSKVAILWDIFSCFACLNVITVWCCAGENHRLWRAVLYRCTEWSQWWERWSLHFVKQIISFIDFKHLFLTFRCVTDVCVLEM